MVIINTTTDLGLALLLAVVFAEYAKARAKSTRGWTWVGVAGIFLVFAGIPSTVVAPIPAEASTIIGTMFAVLGWLLALIGTIFVAYETLLEK